MLCYNVSADDRFLLSSTSKGNKFIKADSLGHEGTAETLVSELEQYIVGFDYVDYTQCEIIEDGISYKGCVCDYFLKDGESTVTMYRILEQYFKSEREFDLLLEKSGIEKLNSIVNICSVVTSIPIAELRKYLSNMIRLDAIILNEDRHLNNIVFIRDVHNKYKVAPIFDNGLSLLSDVNAYSDVATHNLPFIIRKVKAKPFSTSFKRQVSYFSDYPTLRINYKEFIKNLGLCYSIFNDSYYEKAKEVLLYQLKVTKGIVWDEL